MKKRILWAEDEEDQISFLLTLLLESGHEVLTATSYQDIQQKLNDGWHGDLIILDSFMPNKDGKRPQHCGCDLFDELRNGQWGEWGNNVEVLFLTGYFQIVSQKIEGITPPPIDVLSKPCNQEILESFMSKISIKANNIESVSFAVGQTVSDSSNITVHKASTELLKLLSSPQGLAEISKIASIWSTNSDRNIQEAGGKLHALLTTNRDDDKNINNEVSSFSNWLSKKGDEVKNGLTTSANISSITALFFQLIGLC